MGWRQLQYCTEKLKWIFDAYPFYQKYIYIYICIYIYTHVYDIYTYSHMYVYVYVYTVYSMFFSFYIPACIRTIPGHWGSKIPDLVLVLGKEGPWH